MQQNQPFDVVVIGGGPAGLMAAIAAREEGARTLLIDKGDKLGRKLGISGGGRCNVTNAKPLDELMQNIPGNGRFLHSALSRFSNHDIMHFFEGLGIRLKEEDRGRVFPVTDSAATVVRALVDKVFDSGVEVWTETPVLSLLSEEGRVTGVRLTHKRTVNTTAIVVATGGCSVPKTGSTGDAYPWAETVGHNIVTPYPTEVPLTSQERFITNRSLQGLSLRGVDVSIFDERNKRLTTESGDMIFTHLGLSGPVALRCSHYVSTALRKNSDAKLRAEIDCSPGDSKQHLIERLEARRKTDPKKHLRNVLLEWFPERLVDAVLAVTNVDGATQMTHLKSQVAHDVVAGFKAFRIGLTGTLPLAQATVTGGGVSVKEIDPKTMASKVCAGLYFAGEVMDVHAHTGGYNITVAFSTGRLAGASAAFYAVSQNEVPQ